MSTTAFQTSTVEQAMRDSGHAEYLGYAGRVTDMLNHYRRVDSRLLVAWAGQQGVRLSDTVAENFLRALPRTVDEPETPVDSAVDAEPEETEDERDHRETGPDGDARTYDPETGDKIEFEAFRAQAAEVIRAFITEGSEHLDREEADGFTDDEVTALLILAGLEDEPEPEPEPEPEVAEGIDAGLFARLVAFARRHGFTG